jgi:excisionase family DNA binding protein
MVSVGRTLVFLLDSVIVLPHIHKYQSTLIRMTELTSSSSGGAMVDEYLTIEEAASRVKVKPDTLRLWLRTGRLKGLKAGRLWRVKTTDLEVFLEQSAKKAIKSNESLPDHTGQDDEFTPNP